MYAVIHSGLNSNCSGGADAIRPANVGLIDSLLPIAYYEIKNFIIS